jgi:hypothetical protein
MPIMMRPFFSKREITSPANPLSIALGLSMTNVFSMFCDIVFFLNDFQRYIFICKQQNNKSAKSIDFHIICDFHNRFSTIFAEKPSLFKRHFLAEPSPFCRLGDGDIYAFMDAYDNLFLNF